ncbi:LOW QUALITY PROTEIN: hypothetical protein RJ641_035056 [Dillenia turbinata]|uniref:Uncharacterized protein n=1 Tax=Dillenia turbinata TaxID=194707 RepID=A0AAN8VSB7_9MAGN
MKCVQFPGLPEEMSLTYFDFQTTPIKQWASNWLLPSSASWWGGPPKPGQMPPWVQANYGSIGLLFNTCDEIERPFLDYMANQMAMPVWATGPPYPNHFRSHLVPLFMIIRSVKIVNLASQRTNELGPTMEEYPQLEQALELSNKPFIWVIPSGSNGGLLPPRVGESGGLQRPWSYTGGQLQLMILEPPSGRAGFYPTADGTQRRSQSDWGPNAGGAYEGAAPSQGGLHGPGPGPSEPVRKEDIVEAIERLMGQDLEEEYKKGRTAAIQTYWWL